MQGGKEITVSVSLGNGSASNRALQDTHTHTQLTTHTHTLQVTGCKTQEDIQPTEGVNGEGGYKVSVTKEALLRGTEVNTIQLVHFVSILEHIHFKFTLLPPLLLCTLWGDAWPLHTRPTKWWTGISLANPLSFPHFPLSCFFWQRQSLCESRGGRL